jgi:hypothetical protein
VKDLDYDRHNVRDNDDDYHDNKLYI